MTLHRITVDRISLTLDGLPVAQAELLVAQLQSALAAQAWPAQAEADPQASGIADAPAPPDGDTLETRLAGPELVQAVASRLMDLIGLTAQARTAPEVAPWP